MKEPSSSCTRFAFYISFFLVCGSEMDDLSRVDEQYF